MKTIKIQISTSYLMKRTLQCNKAKYILQYQGRTYLYQNSSLVWLYVSSLFQQPIHQVIKWIISSGSDDNTRKSPYCLSQFHTMFNFRPTFQVIWVFFIWKKNSCCRYPVNLKFDVCVKSNYHAAFKFYILKFSWEQGL